MQTTMGIQTLQSLPKYALTLKKKLHDHFSFNFKNLIELFKYKLRGFK